MMTLAVLLVALAFVGFFGINQSKNANSTASTVTTADSNNDNSAQSHNTDNSVGASSSGTVASNNKANTIGERSTVNITDGSEGAFSVAKDAIARAGDQAAATLAAASGIAGDAFASQSRTVDDIAAAASGQNLPDQGGRQPWWLYIVGGLVALVAVVFMFKRKG